MLSANYLTHLTVIRKKLVEKVGGFRSDFDGAQDWDLFLRVLRQTARIAHIPKVLYHWRALPTSAASGVDAKPYAQRKQLEVIQDYMHSFAIDAVASFTDAGPLRVTWP